MDKKKNDYRWSSDTEPNKSFKNQSDTEKYLANYRKNAERLMKETSKKKSK